MGMMAEAGFDTPTSVCPFVQLNMVSIVQGAKLIREILLIFIDLCWMLGQKKK